MGYEVRREQLSSRPLAVVRRRASVLDLATVVPEACGLVWNTVRQQQIAGAGRLVAIYWDGEINLEVGVELESCFSGHGEVVGSATPSGAVVALTHFGPYNRLHEAHKAILDWCEKSGHKPAGPNWEIYGHWLEEWNTDPSKIRTDVYYLLETDEPTPGSLTTECEAAG
jgi:effector-binding domain-containing protein